MHAFGQKYEIYTGGTNPRYDLSTCYRQVLFLWNPYQLKTLKDLFHLFCLLQLQL